MSRQLFMQEVVGAPFDWGLASEDFARRWERSALACARSGARAPANAQGPAQFDIWPGEVLDGTPRPWKAHAPDRSWTPDPRPTSIPARRLSRREMAAANARLQLAPPANDNRPHTRADCARVPRPCPFVSCRNNLYLDVSENGWLKLNFPHLEPEEMKESCSLDVAERQDGATLEELGALFNISLEGARQVEIDVLAELRTKLGEDEVAAILGGGGE